MRFNAISTVVIALLVAAGVAGCGARASLDNPSPDERTADADSGQGKKEGDAPKPHKGFILDGLIR